MAKSSKLHVMISSRCDDFFPLNQEKTKLSNVRETLKEYIKDLKISNKNLFEVWISEDAPPASGAMDSWEKCMDEAKKCDILIVLYNGNAGWVESDKNNNIGICHAELMMGYNASPAKVRLIKLHSKKTQGDTEDSHHKEFQAYVKQQNLFRGGTVKTVDDLKERVKDTLHEAIIELTQAGVQAFKGKFHQGAALGWTRMNFQQRQEEMVKVLCAQLNGLDGAKMVGKDDGQVLIPLSDKNILVNSHAIPAALSVPAAKEKVGQPFLSDHLHAEILEEECVGPLHIIACHRGATETQATKLLGFPDATVVSAPFGVFVADNIQKIQFAFIVNCRDESTTIHGVQRFFSWLEQSGEDELVAKRAKSRAIIVQAIANEIKNEKEA